MLIPEKSNKTTKKEEFTLPRIGPKIKPHLTKEQIKEIKTKLQKNDVTFFIVPTAQLKEIITKGESPLVQGLASSICLPILEGNGVIISTRMLIEWMEGKLDIRNSFILNNSDIRILGEGNFKISDVNKIDDVKSGETND